MAGKYGSVERSDSVATMLRSVVAFLPGRNDTRFARSASRIYYCERLALSLNAISMIVCVCNAIRESEVRAAARAGASCPTSAYRARGCKPRCGQCFSFAREVIAAERATA
jgi:bacterioferritin-associated ferredoxin